MFWKVILYCYLLSLNKKRLQSNTWQIACQPVSVGDAMSEPDCQERPGGGHVPRGSRPAHTSSRQVSAVGSTVDTRSQPPFLGIRTFKAGRSPERAIPLIPRVIIKMTSHLTRTRFSLLSCKCGDWSEGRTRLQTTCSVSVVLSVNAFMLHFMRWAELGVSGWAVIALVPEEQTVRVRWPVYSGWGSPSKYCRELWGEEEGAANYLGRGGGRSGKETALGHNRKGPNDWT